MKLRIFCDGSKEILNNIVGCNSFSTMGATKKVGLHWIYKLTTNAPSQLENKGWGRPNLMCDVEEKHLKPNKKME
jgi:hypothetical protein